MKTTLLATLFASTLSILTAAETPAPCCPAPAPAKSACCAEEKPAPATVSCCPEVKPSAPLTSRSLYQLDATWTDDDARALSLTSLRGRPVILAMFFAQCEYACPVIVNDIKRLRAALPESLRDQAQVVLVTFDTARDTPPALKAFRERMGLDASWTLLRGESDSVQELAMLLGVKFKQDARGQFAHSNVLTLLNAEGEIAHQLAGLNGDVSESAQVLATLSKPLIASR